MLHPKAMESMIDTAKNSPYDIVDLFTNYQGTEYFVLRNGDKVLEGASECLYGCDHKGQLVTEYSDSGRELSAKQVFARNVYRTKNTYFWISGYRAEMLEHEVAKDSELKRYETSFEWEV